jgi:hypothetical protein
MDELITVADLVPDRTTNQIGWAVVAAFAVGPLGEPVCVEYRVRAVRLGREYQDFGDDLVNALQNGTQQLETMSGSAHDNWAGSGPFGPKGIPRYVFEEASQRKLIESARSQLERSAPHVGAVAAAFLAETAPTRKPGRPPQRSLLAKLSILEDVEESYTAGTTLEVVAAKHHMSRSAVRDLLSWARKDAEPPLFSATQPGRKGGSLTPEARELLSKLREV